MEWCLKKNFMLTRWAGSNNKTFRNIITPTHEEQELAEEDERSKGQHYTIFHILILFRDPQITSICSYSLWKNKTK